MLKRNIFPEIFLQTGEKRKRTVIDFVVLVTVEKHISLTRMLDINPCKKDVYSSDGRKRKRSDGRKRKRSDGRKRKRSDGRKRKLKKPLKLIFVETPEIFSVSTTQNEGQRNVNVVAN